METVSKAVKESGKTIASGPACTALYGAQYSEETCLVIDVGGTTTDIAMIENGQPVLFANGCSIESWTTLNRMEPAAGPI